MQYNAMLEISALLFLVVIAWHFFTRKRCPSHRNTFFSISIIIGMLDLAADIASAYAITYSDRIAPWLNWLINMLLYLCQISLAPLLFLYTLCVISVLVKKYRWRIALSLVPTVVTIVLLLLNPTLHLFFYFDATGQYLHGPLFPYLYLSTIGYLLASFVIIAVYRRRIRRIEYFTMLVFTSLITISIVMQAFFPRTLVTGVALSLSLCMTYLTMQNPGDMLDPLTGVFDRASFFWHMDGLLKEHKPFQVSMLHIIDADNIENYLGAAAGSKLFKQIGAFLLLQSTADCFRINDSTFCIVTYREEHAQQAEYRILNRFVLSWTIDRINLAVQVRGCRISGHAVFRDTDEMLSMMDQALPLAADGGAFVEIDGELYQRFARAMEVEHLLMRSLNERRVEIALQAIYNIQKGRIVGAEALARLRDDDGTIVMPGEFVPIAERTGMIVRLGEQVLEKACQYLADSGLLLSDQFENMCVNLSVVECVDASLVTKILSITNAYHIPARVLCFEITESAAAVSDTLPAKMDRLRQAGFRFSLDDFGSGYSNYDSIMRLPFGTVKMDRMMLNMSMKSKRSETILLRTIEMVKSLDLDVIVEGVENAEQADMLRSSGIRYVQGFYFFRPMPTDEFSDAFRASNGIARETDVCAPHTAG